MGTDPIHLLAINVTALRKQAGWTQDQLAGACGISRSTVNSIERGSANAELKTVIEISRRLNCDLAQLFGELEVKETPSTRKSRPRKVERIVDEWAPSEIWPLTMWLSRFRFVRVSDLRKFRAPTSIEAGKRYNRIDLSKRMSIALASAPVDAAILMAIENTNNSFKWSTEIVHRAERLLQAMGYPAPTPDRSTVSTLDFDTRIPPPWTQIFNKFKKLRAEMRDAHDGSDASKRTKAQMLCTIGRVAPEEFRRLPVLLDVLCVGARINANHNKKNTKRMDPRRAMQRAIFYNLAEAYFDIYQAPPATTDSARQPFGFATIWAKQFIRLTAERLLFHLSGQAAVTAPESRWLAHFREGLLDADQLDAGTVARRLRQAWREVQAADRGVGALAEIRRPGFLTT